MRSDRICHVLQESPFDDRIGTGNESENYTQHLADDIGAEHAREQDEDQVADGFVAQHGLGVLGDFVAEVSKDPAVDARQDKDQAHWEEEYELIESSSGFQRHIIPVGELKVINDINSRNPEVEKILDISDPTNPVEVAYYDTSNMEGLYVGNWGTYAYLPSGHIISSDRENGLFIINSPLTGSSLEWGDCAIPAGDVNYDGDLNILDIVWVVNFILENSLSLWSDHNRGALAK